MKRERERHSFYFIVCATFDQVAKLPYVQNKWISIGVWLELMKKHAKNDVIDSLNQGGLKRVMTSSRTNKVSSDIRIINESGYYHQRTGVRVNGKPQSIDAIFVTEPGRLPRLVHTLNWQCNIIIELPPSWSPSQTSIRTVSPTPQRRKTNDSAVSTHASTHVSTHASTHASIPITATSPPPSTCYWDSPEARKHFGFYAPDNEEDEQIDVRDIMKNRILQLQNAYFTPSGWKDVIEDNDIENKCNVAFVFFHLKKSFAHPL